MVYYLDNAATTRPYPEVVERVIACLTTDFGNPSSKYQLGYQAKQLLENARQELAAIFNIPSAGIVFCGSGTESDNLALKGVFGHNHLYSGKLITTKLEHAAVANSAKWLAKQGVTVEYLDPQNSTGRIDLAHLESMIDDQTKMISIQHVNSETGIIQDLAAIAEIIRNTNPKVIFHSDGVQAFTKIPVNLKQLGVDLYSISGHKFHGIKGAGALIMTKKIPLSPLVHGGGQESGFRSGTENVAAISAMALAAKQSIGLLTDNSAKIATFSQQFKDWILANVPDVRIFTSEYSVPHVISLSIPGIPGEVLLNHLAESNIMVSTGSACNANAKKLSSTLLSLGLSQEQARGTIRISLSARELPVDIASLLDTFLRVIQDLKRFS